MDYINLLPDQEVNEHGLIYDVGSLYDYLSKIHDPRNAKGKRYALPTLLVLTVLAKLGGEDKPSGIAEWVANRREELERLQVLPEGKAPSHMTFRRMLQQVVDAQELEQMLQVFQQSHYQPRSQEVLGMDGKTVRGSIPVGEMRGTHLLVVYAPKQGLTLAQTPVESKENEIVAAPKVLRQVRLQGAVVMGDAMHTQREISDQIVAAGGDYLWVAKENQPRTHWAIEKLFVHEVCNLRQGAPFSQHVHMFSKVHKQRGRIEKRTLMASTLLNDYLDWPHVAQVFRLETTTWHTKHRGRTCKVAYGLTSLSPQQANPARLLALRRKYWGIESGLHYRRDVTLHEDTTRLTVGASGHNMATLNNVVIALCMLQGFRYIPKARRLFSAQPKLALQLITSAHFPFL